MNIRLLRLASNALPIGSFAHSQGIESANQQGLISDEDSVCAWLEGVYRGGLSKTELPILKCLYRAWSDGDDMKIAHLNALMLASRESKELWLEDQRLGAALKKILDEDAPQSQEGGLNGPQSLVSQWARAAIMWHIEEPSMVQAFAFSWLENACLASAKLLPMGQRQVHRVMNHMFEVIGKTAIPPFTEDQWGPSLPGLAVLSSQHEYQQNRLFLS